MWINGFDTLTEHGVPCYDRESMVSFTTDVFTFFPPTNGILRYIRHAVEKKRRSIQVAPRRATNLATDAGSETSKKAAEEEQEEDDEDGCLTTDQGSDGDSVEYECGFVELARIYIRGGGKHLYFYKGTSTTLSEFALLSSSCLRTSSSSSRRSQACSILWLSFLY